MSLSTTTITSARTVAKGSFRLPNTSQFPASDFLKSFGLLPAFCRVEGVIRPSADSHIEFEVWLPETGWNGRYAGAGNGGFGGSINYYRLSEAVNAGFAGSSTDTGHQGGHEDQSWALGHPQRIVDFDYRAIHETAEKAEEIIAAFYGRRAQWSYFMSCSNGGRQGLMEAQRYPADYDGILAGAPWTPGVLSSVAGVQDADNKTAFDLDAANPDLRPFNKNGAKLIIYQGEDDNPGPTVRYYENVLSRMGERDTGGFIRLYIVPGMGHCEGGSIAGDFGQRLNRAEDAQHSISKALEHWVEDGVAPNEITSAKYKIDGVPVSGLVRTRPICPYPQIARYRGSGNISDASNFECSTSGAMPLLKPN